MAALIPLAVWFSLRPSNGVESNDRVAPSVLPAFEGREANPLEIEVDMARPFTRQAVSEEGSNDVIIATVGHEYFAQDRRDINHERAWARISWDKSLKSAEWYLAHEGRLADPAQAEGLEALVEHHNEIIRARRDEMHAGLLAAANARIAAGVYDTFPRSLEWQHAYDGSWPVRQWVRGEDVVRVVYVFPGEDAACDSAFEEVVWAKYVALDVIENYLVDLPKRNGGLHGN